MIKDDQEKKVWGTTVYEGPICDSHLYNKNKMGQADGKTVLHAMWYLVANYVTYHISAVLHSICVGILTD